jgi:hypothetical protein
MLDGPMLRQRKDDSNAESDGCASAESAQTGTRAARARRRAAREICGGMKKICQTRTVFGARVLGFQFCVVQTGGIGKS